MYSYLVDTPFLCIYFKMQDYLLIYKISCMLMRHYKVALGVNKIFLPSLNLTQCLEKFLMILKLVIFIVIIVSLIYIGSCADEKKRRTKQSIGNSRKGVKKKESFPSEEDNYVMKTEDNQGKSRDNENKKDLSSTEEVLKPVSKEKGCPVSTDRFLYAINRFWNNDLQTAYECIYDEINFSSSFSSSLSPLKFNGVIQAIINSVALYETVPAATNFSSSLPLEVSPIISWEVLGPIPVSKLEIDADPTFYEYRKSKIKDICGYILSLNSIPVNKEVTATKVLSEHVPHAKIAWRTVNISKRSNLVELSFSQVEWNQLFQSLTSQSVLEFQGWARTTTYVPITGMYIINCVGVHTIYVRNNNHTQIVIGDVYRQKDSSVFSAISLKEGVVGITLPLRGAVQLSFSCTLASTKSITIDNGRKATIDLPNSIESKSTLMISAIKHVPHVLVAFDKRNKLLSTGKLLTSIFAIHVQNLEARSLTIEPHIESNKDLHLSLGIRVVKPISSDIKKYEYGPDYSIFLTPGQIRSIPLELYNTSSEETSLEFPCLRGSGPSVSLTLVLTPSRGSQATSRIDFECRTTSQSFLLSYLDHDGSVAQSAIILPLLNDAVRLTTSSDAKIINTKNNTCTNEQDISCHSVNKYPYLLSLHGTGLSPLSQADAYKDMPSGKTEYRFGVSGMFVIAPDRYGAHNWEMVGDMSARFSVTAVREIFSKHPELPQISELPGIIAGHSMGAHGAWMAAVNAPDLSVCVSPAAGWIRKEEYSTGNAFFELDIQNTYTPPGLKSILEACMSEFHVDRLVGNLRNHDVHIRVGGSDMSTPPWFSRRMYRILQSLGINSTLEEVPGKEHWWWDTLYPNDGGALNDMTMKRFYEYCRQHHNRIADGSVPRCSDDYILTAINIGIHSGWCGVSILQQFHYSVESSVEVRCESLNTYLRNSDLGESEDIIDDERYRDIIENRKSALCVVKTNNVRRLKITYPSTLLNRDTLSEIDNLRLITLSNQEHVEICWSDSRPHSPYICPTITNPFIYPLQQRTPVSSGPVRHVYSRPFIVVYGTPSNHNLRLTLRDIAVYIGNAHLAAHDTSVEVMSDIEYRSERHVNDDILANIVFVGGPDVNRVIRNCLSHENSSEITLMCYSPIRFIHSKSQDLSAKPSLSSMLDGISLIGFALGDVEFTSKESVIFTLPITRSRSRDQGYNVQSAINGAYAVVLHASSLNGYLSLSRLAWPVIPPMVRSPFSNYIPDYLVINENGIWSQGFGAVLAAGFWNATWGVEVSRIFFHSTIS